MSRSTELKTFDLLGVPVSATSPSRLCGLIESWQGEAVGHYVCFSDTHSIVKATENEDMGLALRSADVVSPDGTPLAVLGRLLYRADVSRTCGPDMLELLCNRSQQSGLRHYFFGGKDGVAQELSEALTSRYPKLVVAGTFTPPMRPMTVEEDEQAIKEIMATKPDVLWVGLGAPKQEIWMMNHRDRLPGVTLMGVGAAFDFSTENIKRAPTWIRSVGMEWLYRIMQEPKRLGPRYFAVIPRFVAGVSKQIFRRTAPTP